MKYYLFSLILILSGLNLLAQADIISADEFVKLTKANPDVVVVDANKPDNFKANHLKGAVNIYHNDLYQKGDIDGLILSPDELAAIFGAAGISETTPLVIYDDGTQKYSSRVYWILKYIGAQDVKLLHKDLDAWKKVRLPLTAQATPRKAVVFTPAVDASIFATTEEVQANLDNPGVVIVDARTADEYNGVSKSDGHIPNAVNLNYEELLTANGAFKPAEEMKALLEAKGLTPDKELIFYCRTSVRATVAYAALKNVLGYTRVKVYDGAYNEWVATNPVVQ
ncbi:MAG: sulfurtransferase [Phaeodactylibacter sp.]|nr:sulfurtransferase [Phaeodactylibacter sp.]